MAEILWFRRGDGVEMCCEAGSASHERMLANGFELIGGEPREAEEVEAVEGVEEVEPVEAEAPVVPSLKMSKAQLVSIAEKAGVKSVPDSMNKQEIIAAIEAAQQNG